MTHIGISHWLVLAHSVLWTNNETEGVYIAEQRKGCTVPLLPFSTQSSNMRVTFPFFLMKTSASILTYPVRVWCVSPYISDTRHDVNTSNFGCTYPCNTGEIQCPQWNWKILQRIHADGIFHASHWKQWKGATIRTEHGKLCHGAPRGTIILIDGNKNIQVIQTKEAEGRHWRQQSEVQLLYLRYSNRTNEARCCYYPQ